MGFTRLIASKPTVAAISGWCLAGGLELALWCDLRIATGTARLGFTERRFGVPLIDGGTQRLPLVVGMGRALELILTGRVLDAAEALEWGLVNEVVAEEAHLERALEIAEGLAAFPQPTMLSDRRAAIEGAGLPLADGLALEAELGRASVETGLRGAARFAAGEGRGARGRRRLAALSDQLVGRRAGLLASDELVGEAAQSRAADRPHQVDPEVPPLPGGERRPERAGRDSSRRR